MYSEIIVPLRPVVEIHTTLEDTTLQEYRDTFELLYSHFRIILDTVFN